MPRRKKYRKSSYAIPTNTIDEMIRLSEQAFVLNNLLGLLPDVIVLPAAAQILDVACGTGRWAIDMAQLHTDTSITGFDLSSTFIHRACALARQRGLMNTTFLVADARESLPFSDALFDLAHIRFCSSVMTCSTWPHLLSECWRLLRPAGQCLNTELDLQFEDCPQASLYWKWYTKALYQSGNSFTVEGLGHSFFPFQHTLFADSGFVNIITKQIAIDFSFGSPDYSLLTQLLYRGFHQVRSFLSKAGVATEEETQTTLQEIANEIERPTFRGIGYWQHVWGQKAAAS